MHFLMDKFISKIKKNWWKLALISYLEWLKNSDIKVFDEYNEIYFYTENNVKDGVLHDIENSIILKRTLNEMWYHKLFINDFNLFYHLLYFYEEWYDAFWFHLVTKKHILTWNEYNIEWFFYPELDEGYQVTRKFWKFNCIDWYNIFWFNIDWIHKVTKTVYDEFWFDFDNFNSEWLYRFTWEKHDEEWYDINLFNSKWYHKNYNNFKKINNTNNRLIYRWLDKMKKY